MTCESQRRRSWRGSVSVGIASWIALECLLGTPLAAQSFRINGDLPREEIEESVARFLLTADGSRAVHGAQRSGGRMVLYSTLVDGSQPPISLGPDLVDDFFLTPEGRVVYLSAGRLRSVPADGSAGQVPLSDQARRASEVVLDASGKRVFYKHEVSPGAFYGTLHSVPADGSASPRTVWDEPSGSRIWGNTDGSLALFSVFESATFVREHLYATSAEESGPLVELASTTPETFFPFEVQDLVTLTHDGVPWALYYEVQDVEGNILSTLHSVPLDASAAARSIPGFLSRGGKAPYALDASTPARLVFRNSDAEVRSARIDGSSPMLLGASSSRPVAFGSDAYFRAFLGGWTILRVPTDGGTPAQPLFPGEPGLIGEPILPVSIDRVAFLRSAVAHSVEIGGGTPALLHATPPLGGAALELIGHPAASVLLVRGDLETDEDIGLYAVPADASALPERLDTGSPGADVQPGAVMLPDRTEVAFRSTLPGRTDLHVVPVDGSTPPLRLNEPLPGGIVGDVVQFAVSPDERVLVYRADELVDEHFDLFVADTVRAGPPILLTAQLPGVAESFALLDPGPVLAFQASTQLYVDALRGEPPAEVDSAAAGFGSSLALASGGARLVYLRAVGAGRFELVSRLLDGLAPPERLHEALPAQGSVTAFRIAADDTVVFRADLGQDEIFELHAVPAKGGTPRRLNGPLVGGGDVQAFDVDPTGRFVAYLADALVDQRVELFALPIDGSREAVRRSGALPPGGDVLEMAFSSDGWHLVYRADQVSDERFDLFRVSVVGAAGKTPRRAGGEALRLTFLPGGRRVQPDWRLTHEGASVVYRANPSAGNELFRVPIDGRSSPVRLSGALPSGGAVTAFELALDGTRAVYLADQRVAGVVELFSVPLAGGLPLLLAQLPATGDVTHAKITPDSHAVVFRADAGADEVFQLYRVPIDGSLPPRLLNDVLTDGDVQVDFVALDDLALYRANPQGAGVFELFGAR